MKAAGLVTTSPPLAPDTYIYRIISGYERLLSISSDDSLRLIDRHTLQHAPPYTFSQIHHGITCLGALEDRGILTAGRDGVVKCTDPRTSKSALDISKEPKSPILSLACRGALIAAGTELTNSQATIILWDSRATRQPLLEYIESHNDDVTELSFHPSHASTLLSGSTDGLVNLYDTTITDEDDALTQVFNHGSSIAHAGFLSDHEVYVLSHDEIFSIYDTGDSQHDDARASTHAFGDLRPQLQCEYVVDLVSSGSAGPLFGAGSHSAQYLDLVPLQKPSNWSLDTPNAVRLPGAHGEEIVRSICFCDDSDMVFTAGEDGLIKAWQFSEEAGGSTHGKDPTHINKKRKKHKSFDEHGRTRFNPF